MMINVGIATQGDPIINPLPGGEINLVSNMLIGLGFHWERTIMATLPGELITNTDPVFKLVNRLPLEQYLECVVGSEMNPSAPPEFLKAHTVIARSWALGKITGKHDDSSEGKIFASDRIIDWEDTCDHHGFDVCSDDHCQRYQGVQQFPESVLKSVKETKGEVLVSRDGKLVDTRFSKCCGGKTEVFSSCWQDREEPSLESVEDPWCDLSGLGDDERRKVLSGVLKDYDLSTGGGHDWTVVVTPEEIRDNLRVRFARDIGEIEDIKVLQRGQSERATSLQLIGTRGKIAIGKELMIRRLLSPTHLYSSSFEIEPRDSVESPFVLTGHGWGHGVGLCQIGAARMALAGHDYRSILSFYYPGSKIIGTSII